MISGNIHENSNLALLPEPLQRAVNFLKETDLAHHEPGRFELDGDRMILQVLDQTTGPREGLRPEVHRKYIDVQFLAAGGPERIGWYPDLGDNEVDEDLLDTPRDICFYKNNANAREGVIEMQPGSYAMFFPWDVHIPAIQAGSPAPIRKIVVKVALDSCLELLVLSLQRKNQRNSNIISHEWDIIEKFLFSFPVRIKEQKHPPISHSRDEI